MNMESANPNAELKERLGFETLIADLSSKFVNVPASKVDSKIVDAQRLICSGKGGKKDGQGQGHESPGKRHPRNYSWAELMKRVFGLDFLRCDFCGGRMRILCAVNPPEAIKRILDCLGLPSRPPPISPAVQGDDFTF